MGAKDTRLGEIALELIGGYPLYASTSNISYDEAIAVAKVLFGNDIEQVYQDRQADDELDGLFEKMKGETK